MRGSLRQRFAGSWSLIIDRQHRDPITGTVKRQQKWITFRGTKRDAQAKLNELLNAHQNGVFIDPSKRTLGNWLAEWLDKAIKPPHKTPRTFETYKGVIANHLEPKLGIIRLQELKSIDLEHYYAEQATTLAPATLQQHHMILHGCLEQAVREGIVMRNVAKLVSGKPRAPEGHAEEIEQHCWTSDEAKAFLDTAKAAGDQPAAFYALALETGMRKSELGGLKWTDIDLRRGAVRIQRQIVTLYGEVSFGPVKNKKPRTVTVTDATATLLRRHRAHQAEVKLQSGGRYQDHGLVFAKEWAHVRHERHTLGQPLGLNNIGQQEFARLIKVADVRTIKFHGMRHTCATLALQAGVSAKVVQERLGHKKVMTTLDIYAHVLPAMDQDAADRIGAAIHG